MNKKILFYVVLIGAFMMITPALAETNCDSQAKPALGCPTGYSMMCIPVGGDHWGCGKESNGMIIEASVSSSAELSEDETMVQTEVSAQSAAETDSRRDDDTSSSERVLPTVNKNTDDDNDGADERVLPTVNKKTTAKVEVRGWDPEKKEAIEMEVESGIADDDAVRKVEINQENVNVTYATRAKLFGFIPMTMNMDISSDAEGRVKVKFPWYRFLASTDYAKSAEVLNYIFQNNETDFEFLRTKGSVEAQLEIFMTIKNVMHEMSKSIIQNIKA